MPKTTRKVGDSREEPYPSISSREYLPNEVDFRILLPIRSRRAYSRRHADLSPFTYRAIASTLSLQTANVKETV